MVTGAQLPEIPKDLKQPSAQHQQTKQPNNATPCLRKGSYTRSAASCREVNANLVPIIPKLSFLTWNLQA
jgi:hypothetical protein